MTVFQQIILCYWFDSNALPFVFGLLLFFVKVVRAANDNFASMFYNATHSIEAFFWIGFAVTVASLLSAYYLMLIHEAVVEATNANKEKEKNEKERVPLNAANNDDLEKDEGS